MAFLLTYIDVRTVRFFHLLNPDWSIQISSLPAVCKALVEEDLFTVFAQINSACHLPSVEDQCLRYFLRSCLACDIRDWHRSRCWIFKLSTPVQLAWSSWATISQASLGKTFLGWAWQRCWKRGRIVVQTSFLAKGWIINF